MSEIDLSLLTFGEGRGRSRCVMKDRDRCSRCWCYELAEHIRQVVDSSAGLPRTERLLCKAQVSAHAGNTSSLGFLSGPQSCFLNCPEDQPGRDE